MYTLLPFQPRRGLSRHPASFPFDDSFFKSFFDLNDRVGHAAFPVNIRDRETHYLLEAELPGLSQDQINITADHDSLTISADFASECKEEGSFYCERRSGHVSRTFRLEGIDEENITADYRDGLLVLTLPKEQPAPQPAQRRIPIGRQE